MVNLIGESEKVSGIEYMMTLRVSDKQLYDTLLKYIEGKAHHKRFISTNNNMHYFFDVQETQVIKTDGQEKIDIGYLVADVIDSIKHILNHKSERLVK